MNCTDLNIAQRRPWIVQISKLHYQCHDLYRSEYHTTKAMNWLYFHVSDSDRPITFFTGNVLLCRQLHLTLSLLTWHHMTFLTQCFLCDCKVSGDALLEFWHLTLALEKQSYREWMFLVGRFSLKLKGMNVSGWLIFSEVKRKECFQLADFLWNKYPFHLLKVVLRLLWGQSHSKIEGQSLFNFFLQLISVEKSQHSVVVALAQDCISSLYTTHT